MAKAHTNGVPSNPDVRFERTDADISAIVKGAAYLFGLLAVVAALTTWLAWYLTRAEDPLKKSDLPPARVDESVAGSKTSYLPVPPQPRLEAIEGVREERTKNFEMYPPRAAEAYAKEKKEIRDLNPVAKGLEGGKRLFPVRKDADAQAKEAPTNYNIALPSKSSAGRVTTGGQ